MSRRRFGNNHRWANAVPAGAEDDDDNDGLIDDEPDDRLEKFGEIQISRMVEEEEDEPCLEEEMLFGRPRRAQPVAPAFHAWSSLGVNERSSDEEEPYFMKSQALAMPGKQVHQPDTRTDRDLVDFLRAFDCEEAYDVLQQRGISLRQLLEMTDDDISDIVTGVESLLMRRKVVYGVQTARQHEWISNQAVNFLYGLLNAGRMPVGEGDRPGNWDERQRAMERADRDLGSAAQQVLAAGRFMGFFNAGMGYMKKVLHRCQLNADYKERQTDLEEIRINAENLVRAADRLKGSLALLRSVMTEKAAAPAPSAVAAE